MQQLFQFSEYQHQNTRQNFRNVSSLQMSLECILIQELKNNIAY